MGNERERERGGNKACKDECEKLLKSKEIKLNT